MTTQQTNYDTLELILMKLSPDDIIKACGEMPLVKNLCSDDSFWRFKAKQDFGVSFEAFNAKRGTAVAKYKEYKTAHGVIKFLMSLYELTLIDYSSGGMLNKRREIIKEYLNLTSEIKNIVDNLGIIGLFSVPIEFKNNPIIQSKNRMNLQFITYKDKKFLYYMPTHIIKGKERERYISIKDIIFSSVINWHTKKLLRGTVLIHLQNLDRFIEGEDLSFVTNYPGSRSLFDPNHVYE